MSIANMGDLYGIFHNSKLTKGDFKGICSGRDANDILLSSVEELLEPLAVLSFNKDGYSKYCKDYKEYWEWVELRNDLRYENTIAHGKNYDAKNMMHTFRLLNMAEEIAKEGIVNVRRADRDILLKIRSGFFSYEELVELAKEKIVYIDELYEKSDLPDAPNLEKIEDILVEMRESIYSKLA